MLKRLASAGLFVLLVTCGGACQEADSSLPDAPSARAATFKELAVESRNPLNFAAINSAEVWRKNAFASPYQTVRKQERSNTLLEKYLHSSGPRRGSSDHIADSGTMMGRATNAAARIFFTRDESGKERVNTSYFLRALTAVAADTASRPYRRRPATEPFSAFGSTVGNDAGMNLLHEFQPGIQHLVLSHAPKFVVKMIGERLGQR